MEVIASDADRAKAAEVLYPGLFADEAERRHPGQVNRIAAALAAERAAAVEQIKTDVRALAEELEGTGRALVKRPDQLPSFHGRQVLVSAARLRAVVADTGKPDTSSEEEA